MFSLETIKRAKNRDEEALVQLYVENRNLFVCMGNDLRVRSCDFDDFMQVCFLALKKTVDVWEEGKYSFLSYLRVNVRGGYFTEKLRMNYPVKLHNENYKNPPQYELCDYSETLESYPYTENKFEEIEREVLFSGMWEDFKCVLTEREYFVLYEKYKNGRALKEIAKELCCSSETARRAEKSALQKLKGDEFVMSVYSGL